LVIGTFFYLNKFINQLWNYIINQNLIYTNESTIINGQND
jgi:hypothetical protein